MKNAPKLTKGQTKSIADFANKNNSLRRCTQANEFVRMHKGVKVTWVKCSDRNVSWYKGYIGAYWIAGAF
jgi:hypothetical protein